MHDIGGDHRKRGMAVFMQGSGCGLEINTCLGLDTTRSLVSHARVNTCCIVERKVPCGCTCNVQPFHGHM